MHIGWYAAANDVGVHDMRWADRGSNLLQGPGRLHADRDRDPRRAPRSRTQLRLAHARQRRASCRTPRANLIFPFGSLVADLSRFMTLEPGDVILTGTPAGAGGRRPRRRVEVELDGRGTVTQPSSRRRPRCGPSGRSRNRLRPRARRHRRQRPRRWSRLRRGDGGAAHVSTATLSVQLARRGVSNTFLAGLRPTRPDLRLLGYAYTLRYVPLREDVVSRVAEAQRPEARDRVDRARRGARDRRARRDRRRHDRRHPRRPRAGARRDRHRHRRRRARRSRRVARWRSRPITRRHASVGARPLALPARDQRADRLRRRARDARRRDRRRRGRRARAAGGARRAGRARRARPRSRARPGRSSACRPASRCAASTRSRRPGARSIEAWARRRARADERPFAADPGRGPRRDHAADHAVHAGRRRSTSTRSRGSSTGSSTPARTAISVGGSTGEPISQTVAERIAVMRAAAAAIDGRVPFLPGTGAAPMDETLELTAEAQRARRERRARRRPLLRAPPAGRCWSRGTRASPSEFPDLPIIVYNVPIRARPSTSRPRPSGGSRAHAREHRRHQGDDARLRARLLRAERVRQRLHRAVRDRAALLPDARASAAAATSAASRTSRPSRSPSSTTPSSPATTTARASSTTSCTRSSTPPSSRSTRCRRSGS